MAGTKLGSKRGPYKPKKLKFEHSCEKCNSKFLSADVKGKICSDCKSLIMIYCKCGCNKKFKRSKWQVNLGKTYWLNHNKTGKTYLEIYGTNNPNCGFKQGIENPMSNPEILNSVLAKINKGKIFDGIRFRSSYELEIYKILKENNQIFEYEPVVKSSDGTWFKPDFVINKTFIEVSGYASAFEPGRLRNLFKIKKLENTYDLLIFITSGRFIPWYTEKIKSKKVILLTYEEVLKTNTLLWDHLK
jgi:hypothetical protein